MQVNAGTKKDAVKRTFGEDDTRFRSPTIWFPRYDRSVPNIRILHLYSTEMISYKLTSKLQLRFRGNSNNGDWGLRAGPSTKLLASVPVKGLC